MNHELVTIKYSGLFFDALVSADDVVFFYEDEPLGEMFKLFDRVHRAEMTRLAVTAALKQAADKTAFDKWSDAKC